MKDFVKRMIAEKEELEGRISKLTKAINNPPFGCREDQLIRMKDQLATMKAYRDILIERIEADK